MSARDAYNGLHRAVNDACGEGPGFTQLIATRPYAMKQAEHVAAIDRHAVILELFERALDVLEAALAGDEPPELLAMLMNDTPGSLASNFHRAVLSRRRSIPQFFRTDEVSPGRIIEIQCPGSLWGECEALSHTYGLPEATGGSFAAAFSQQLAALLPEPPVVHHLLDNASVPHTMRYFIEKTRPAVKYFGFDRDVRQMDCNFVRSHSIYGLTAENFFRPRLERYLAGELVFDLPPLIIFDEKITLALPFLETTRDRFSDAVRDALVYSTPVLPSGILLPTGECIALDRFAALPRARRRWMLKYAGSDVSINWGSRAVHSLHNLGREACLKLLQRAADDRARGGIWIMQPQEQVKGDVEYVTPSGETVVSTLTLKHSSFYGPAGHLAALVQYRNFYKVHGQHDTIVTLGLPAAEVGAGRQLAAR